MEAAAAPPSGGLVRGVVAKEVAEALPGTVEAYNYFRVWHGLGEGRHATGHVPGRTEPQVRGPDVARVQLRTLHVLVCTRMSC